MLFDETLLQRLRDNDASLTRLDLDSQSLTDEEIFQLCEAFKTNTTLISLNLTYNEISDWGAKYLSENKTLSSLDLSLLVYLFLLFENLSVFFSVLPRQETTSLADAL